MKKLLKPITVILAAAAILGCSSPDEGGLRARLEKAAAEGKTLYGHQDDLMYGRTWNATDDMDTTLVRSDVLYVSGHYPAVLGLDLGGLEIENRENLDSNDFDLMRRAAVLHAERGGVVTLSWHLRNPLTGGSAWDVSNPNTVASILEGGEKHEEFLRWLDRIAAWIDSVRDKDGKPVEMIFRPWHEHTGNWFWWGPAHCSPEQFNELWVMTYNYLVGEKGLKSMLWAISPNHMDNIAELMAERYPGDEYVDLVGLDFYENMDAETLEAKNALYIAGMRKGLTFLSEFAAARGKLLAVTETGFEGLHDPQWFTKAVAPAIEGFPVCYLLTWRNSNTNHSHFYSPWPGHPSTEDFLKWVESGKIELL